jgi:hypothetical protein
MAASDAHGAPHSTQGAGTSKRATANQAAEVLYTTVGAGLLGVQRLMVARHDARRQAATVLGEMCRTLDGAFETVEGLLPEPAGAAMRQSRRSARDLGRFVSVVLGVSIATDRPGPSEP